ncbi:MAG: hypothetical protein P4L68_06650, partial [Methylovirgula sp.]|nr:hypothetical protein [Methylovirgula sp.]
RAVRIGCLQGRRREKRRGQRNAFAQLHRHENPSIVIATRPPAEAQNTHIVVIRFCNLTTCERPTAYKIKRASVA